MIQPIDRRALVRALAASTALGVLADGGPGALAAQPGLRLGPPAPFSFEALKATARRKQAEPYAPPAHPDAKILDRIDYDAWGEITFKTDAALFKDSRLPVTFFHLGKFFQSPVAVYA
jgi:glucans biosynthesis protein